MSELKLCPFCGGDDLTTERPATNPVGCDSCGLYVATPEDWNTRALAPALETVIKAVEAMPESEELHNAVFEFMANYNTDPSDKMPIYALLRALRSEAGETGDD